MTEQLGQKGVVVEWQGVFGLMNSQGIKSLEL